VQRVREAKAKSDRRLDEKVKEARQRDASREQAWADEISRMKERIMKRPLLVESYQQQRRLDGTADVRRSALVAVRDALRQAGIDDVSKYLDPSELHDIALSDSDKNRANGAV